MAKKFVRGVTGVDDIEKFDKSLTNVNDLVSDGQYTYVHTKKGTTESYYNLTTESYDNLLTSYGIRKDTNNNKTTISIDTVSVPNGFDLNNFNSGFIRSTYFTNAPYNNTPFYVVALGSVTGSVIQIAIKRIYSNVELNQIFLRTKINSDNIWSNWKQYGIDNDTLNTLLASKQNTITNNTSIGVSGTGLRQLYTNKQSYTHANGILKTHIKSISANTSVTTAEEEFNFIIKINKGATSATFTLNANDTTKFNNIMSTYGKDSSVHISGLILTLSGSNLTVTTANNVNNNYVITFSDII